MEMANETATDAIVKTEKRKEINGRLPFKQEFFQIKPSAKSKKKDDYFVLECENLFKVGSCYIPVLSKALAKGMKKLLIKNEISKDAPILVVGIGNNGFVVDSLGPKTVRKIIATGAYPESQILKLRRVYAFNPDVSGKTGLQTSKTVSAIVSASKVSAVILIDSFASKSPSRLGKSFQFASCGLIPGAGVNSDNSPITSNELGVPVFSLGVPLVAIGDAIFNEEESKNYVFAPKSVDNMINYCSEIMSNALNQCLLQSLSLKEIEMLKSF